MSRIAVTPSRGDDVEKIAFLGPLAGALGSAASTVGGALASGAGAAARGIAGMAGQTSIGQGLSAAKEATGIGGKIKAGVKAAGKAHAKKKLGLKEGEEATGLDVLSATSQSLGDAQANAQAKKDEQTQGAMDAARRHAEINTNKGEAMELAWLLLKGVVRSKEELEDWYAPDIAHSREKYKKKLYDSRMANNTVNPFLANMRAHGIANLEAGIPEWLKYAHEDYEPLVQARTRLTPEQQSRIPYSHSERRKMKELTPTAKNIDMTPAQLYNLQRLSTTMIPQNFLMRDDAIEYEGITESGIPGMVFINGKGPVLDPRPNIQRKEPVPEPEPERNLPVLQPQQILQPQIPILQPRPIMTGEAMELAWRLLKIDEGDVEAWERWADRDMGGKERRRVSPTGRRKLRSMGEGSPKTSKPELNREQRNLKNKIEQNFPPQTREQAERLIDLMGRREDAWDMYDVHPGSFGHVQHMRNEIQERDNPWIDGIEFTIPHKDTHFASPPFIPKRDYTTHKEIDRAIGLDTPIPSDEMFDILGHDEPARWRDDTEIQHYYPRQTHIITEGVEDAIPSFAGTPFNELTGFHRSEPMDLSFRLLKELYL